MRFQIKQQFFEAYTEWNFVCLFGNGQKSIFVNGCLRLDIYYYISRSIFADEAIKPSILELTPDCKIAVLWRRVEGDHNVHWGINPSSKTPPRLFCQLPPPPPVKLFNPPF